MRFQSFIHLLLIIGLTYAAYLLLLLSAPYLALKPNVEFLLTKQLIYHVKLWRISFYVHVFSSVTLVVAGLFQFSRYILKKYTMIHRVSGFIYLITVLLISGPAALVMSFYANGGIPAQISFVLLSGTWLCCTFTAWRFLRKKEYERHGNWMLRSYALTLSAVTLRLYAYLFDVWKVDLNPIDTYILLAWMSWIPNLMIAELMIRKGFVKRIIH